MATSNPAVDLTGMSGEPEFINNEKTVLVFNTTVEARDVIESLKQCIKVKIWAQRSRITILSGFHTSQDGEIGKTCSGFTSNISTHFERMYEEIEEHIEELNYQFETVTLTTFPYYSEDGSLKYKLNRLSLNNLTSKFQDVIESDYQNVLIFATCHSKKSHVNDFIEACGLYPALFLSADLGMITKGRRFQLDEKQRSIIKIFAKVIF